MAESKYSIRAKYIALEVFGMPKIELEPIKKEDKNSKPTMSPLDERLLVVEQVLDRFIDNLAYLIEKQIVDTLIPPPDKVAKVVVELRSKNKKKEASSS